MTESGVAPGSACRHGRALIGLRRYDEARTVLEQAVSDAPDDAEAWCLLSQAQYGCHDAAGARRSAASAVANEPEYEWAHRLLSLAELALGHHKEAEAAAREAALLAPNLWLTHVQLAQALSAPRRWRFGRDRRRRVEEATAEAARAVELAPNEPTAHVVTGMVAVRRRDRAFAQQAFLRALALDPLDEDAQNGLAALKLRMRSPEDLAGAATDYANVLSIDPRALDSRRGVEHVLRVFLAWTCYLVFLDVYFLGPVGVHTDSLAARLLPVAVLAIPALYAARFVARLTPDLRAYLFRLPLLVARLRLVVALEAVAVGALVAVAAAPQEARATLAGVSAGAALLARLRRVADGPCGATVPPPVRRSSSSTV
jgi:tetratricopeptide (TPR) repeat protein